jgi:uncharacterized membrane protein SpoIIM required for sporulation
VDIDRFIVLHEAEWARLAELSRGAGRAGRELTGADIDELVPLYQRVSLHLSQARTVHRDAGLVRRLSTVVAAAHAAIYGARVARLSTVRRFFGWTFPAAVYTARRQVAAAAVLLFGTAIGLGLLFWLAPQRVDLVMPAHVQHEYLDHDFVKYYSENHSIFFFSHVTTNNIEVGVEAFALGALGVLPGAWILFQNGAYIGLVAGLFARQGRFWNTFMVYILPHGLMELSAVTITAAAGMRVGWALFAPGDRSRTQAIAAEGQRSVMIILGGAACFVVAGSIEGFVTGSPILPAAVKVLIGVFVWVAFLLYVIARGRMAVRAGFSGGLEELRPTWVPVDPLAGLELASGPRAWADDPLAGLDLTPDAGTTEPAA